jgi:hypothetical protein
MDLTYNDILSYAQQISKETSVPLPKEQDLLTLSLWISENDPSNIESDE